ncbi:MAG: hypothetical protein FJZ59_02585 [Chlamydiae bacterium]|jgi:hypothetical protein|nr:hypothetical protein [Chlamydiota bacterium]
MKKTIIIAFFLLGCSYGRIDNSSLSHVANTKRLKEVSREFLQDIGGEEVAISPSLKGTYFNPKKFQKNEISAYKKWRKLFAIPKNCTIAEMYQIDYQGISLLSLFSLPKTHTIKKDSAAALCLPSFSIPYEFDPRWILSYLAKGVHVLAINYENEEKTTSLDAEAACTKALKASEWLQAHTSGKIFILGKSLGAIPASYVAANTPKASLILENPIILERHKTHEWLKNVEGKILAIQTFNEEKKIILPNHAILMTIMGSHFGAYWGDTYKTWYENEKDQLKLLRFLGE